MGGFFFGPRFVGAGGGAANNPLMACSMDNGDNETGTSLVRGARGV
jgi:hypothetical protein